MTLVVLGIDALDPDLVNPADHPNLTLERHRRIDTIVSVSGEPSTHELWPTIISGLTPDEHGLKLESGGVGWEHPALRIGSTVADYVIPDSVQTKVGAWILDNTELDAFRTPATYFEKNDISTVFDGREAKPIGIPNYVVDPNEKDREHALRQRIGEFMDRNPDAEHSHTTDDRVEFYERCLEMVMVRIARSRRALRGRQYELVFGYTSGLDLVGHVAYDSPAMQMRAYEEIDQFVGELRTDLDADDELLLVSDHGLQDGKHTDEAMVASTSDAVLNGVESVTDVRDCIEREMTATEHQPTDPWADIDIGSDAARGAEVREQLEDLGYM